MDCNDSIKLSMNIPFPSIRQATITCDVLRVDAEPKRSGVSKNITVEGNILKVIFSSKEARQLRVAVHSFFDYLILVSETMEQFGPPRSQEYSPKIPSPVKT